MDWTEVGALGELDASDPGSALAIRQEVTLFLRQVMRGEADEKNIKDRLKAAELLGKAFGLFAEGAAPVGAVTIVDDLAGAAAVPFSAC